MARAARPSLRGPAREVARPEAEREETGGVDRHTKDDKAEDRRNLELPGRIQPPAGLAHGREEHDGHERDGGQYLQDEDRPARLRGVNGILSKLNVEQPGIQTGSQADGEGEAGVTQGTDEGQVHELGGDERNNAYLYRSHDVLSCIEAGGEDLYKDHAYQPDTVGDQRPLGHPRIIHAEAAVLEEHRNERQGQDRERDRAWNG